MTTQHLTATLKNQNLKKEKKRFNRMFLFITFTFDTPELGNDISDFNNIQFKVNIN